MLFFGNVPLLLLLFCDGGRLSKRVSNICFHVLVSVAVKSDANVIRSSERLQRERVGKRDHDPRPSTGAR